MVDMEQLMKQLEEAKQKSAMEKEKADKEKKEKEVKEKKYKEAWSALPKPSEFPDFAEAIRKKQNEYERHFAPSLFTDAIQENEVTD